MGCILDHLVGADLHLAFHHFGLEPHLSFTTKLFVLIAPISAHYKLLLMRRYSSQTTAIVSTTLEVHVEVQSLNLFGRIAVNRSQNSSTRRWRRLDGREWKMEGGVDRVLSR